MNYQEFLEYIMENVEEYLCNYEQWLSEQKGEQEEYVPNTYQVTLHKVLKNNGIVLDGITIRKEEENISPYIYLNHYFDSYQMGKTIGSILEEIVHRYVEIRKEEEIELVDIFDYEAVKDKIILRLINYDKNRNLLKSSPHKRYLDLAITFRFLAGKNPCGISSAMVGNHEFEAWNISVEELYRVALFNTMNEFPWQMESLAQVLLDSLKEKMPSEEYPQISEQIEFLQQTETGVNLFVLSNHSGLNGATCILYDSVLKNFAKVQDCNIFILPSSVHEVILVPENADTEPEFLQNLVIDGNQSAVGLIDLLSDNIYYYDKEKDQIIIYGNN